MKDDQLHRLSRRRVLGGLGAIGLASAGAGLGTSAFLNDRESFEDAVLTAGTLDLLVDYHSYWDQGRAGSGQVTGTKDGSGTVSGTLTDVKPGDSGLLAFCPRIVDNPAYLWLCGELTSNDENGQTEPEANHSDDDTGGDPGAGMGELADSVVVDVDYCTVDVAASAPEDEFGPGDVSKVADVWEGTLADFLAAIQNGVPLDGDANTGDGAFLAPGEQACFAGGAEADNYCLCIDWEVPVSVGNEIQSDSLSFDLEFHAEQCRNNDGTRNPCADDAGPDCDPCELPGDVADSELVSVNSVDAASFPDVSLFVRVDTPAGNAGDLTAGDFEVCENGLAQSESVSFTSGSLADVVFVFDDTGSMGEEIAGAQAAITNFVDALTNDAGIDSRFALVSYKDTVELDQDFTDDQATIEAAIDDLSASGGSDGREDNFDALGVATRDIAADSGGMLSAYRPGAQKVVIDITDAPAQVDDPDAYDNDESRTDYVMSEVATLLDGFTYIAVSEDLSESSFFDDPGYADGDKEVLADMVDGSWFELPESDADEFSDLLTDEVAGLLSTTYTVSYTSCDADADPAERPILLAVDDPDEGTLYRNASLTVPT
ncbi:VWA domain-containing protein [Halobacterium litoreum]|uniref:VWA domain-containing protein n=1 Tax=Halobacterium litoreum TaxID=2039234 RepID=A0ABD5NCZ4_9EURY|nr:VWA domain-containing protein [Halobacterium litoreum]UHH14059.1 VWA domain-containing protein [Halobacterium litoreum]